MTDNDRKALEICYTNVRKRIAKLQDYLTNSKEIYQETVNTLCHDIMDWLEFFMVYTNIL
jgi:hypothetical protein